MTHWQQISEHISQTLNRSFQIQKKSSVGGGSINSSYHAIGTDSQEYFIKLNVASLETMFQVEFDSLNELSQSLSTNNSAMKVPLPICFGTANSHSYLVLEYQPISSSGNSKTFGQALAEMHKITTKQYGWYQNNIIGSTPQSNCQHNDWITFWREERIRPQFEMLYDKGYKKMLQPLSDQLLNNLDSLLVNHTPQASLLHGDLWSGNYGFLSYDQPVIFDPALYYGDRETDIAMTELFGGFSQDFYDSYNETWPLDEGYTRRKTVYNLYHILNHANLFGTSYLNQAMSMMERLC
ncbi:MAG: fructosamine kinase family protein [Gammaproteobacteria bacterium]|nr:fructosamine kinase family protein [Gammaproteobacteria bacterium]